MTTAILNHSAATPANPSHRSALKSSESDLTEHKSDTTAHSISVLIPTHNRRHTLARSIDSVLAQTLAPLEVIVIDDGSTDDSAAWIRQTYPQVQVLEQEQRGVSAARNSGIAAASGNWIALLDSDDEWLPEKLAQQSLALQQQPQHLLCHCDEIWIRCGVRVNPKRRHRKYGGWIFEHCLPLCAISPSAALIHRQVFEKLGRFDEDLPACEDYDYWLRFCAQHPVLFVDQLLLKKYGGHDDQLSRHYPAMDQFRITALEKLLHSGCLNQHQTQLCITTLLEKLSVYTAGCRKRGRHEEADALDVRARHWQRQGELSQVGGPDRLID